MPGGVGCGTVTGSIGKISDASDRSGAVLTVRLPIPEAADALDTAA